MKPTCPHPLAARRRVEVVAHKLNLTPGGTSVYTIYKLQCVIITTKQQLKDVEAAPRRCHTGGCGLTGNPPGGQSAAAGSTLPALRQDSLLHPPGAQAPVQRRRHDRRLRLLPRLCQSGGGDLRGRVGLSGQVRQGAGVCVPGVRRAR